MKITFQSCPTSNIPCAECGHYNNCTALVGGHWKDVAEMRKYAFATLRESTMAYKGEAEALREQLRTTDAALAAMTTERNEVARQLTVAEGKLAAIRAEIDSPEWLLRDTRIRAILDGAGERDATREDHDAAAQAVLDAMWRDGAGEG